MHDMDVRHKFLELRAKGLSLARIAKRIKVSKRTLVDWCKQDRETIRALRAVELEALQEKILDSREMQLQTLQSQLNCVEEAIGEIPYKYLSAEILYRMAAMLRSEIRKVCETPDMIEAALAKTTEPEPPPKPTVQPLSTLNSQPSTLNFTAPASAHPHVEPSLLNQRASDPSGN